MEVAAECGGGRGRAAAPTVIVDASVIVAANSDHEAGHVVARAWYDVAVQGKLAAPMILWSEVAAAIARESGSADLAERVIANLRVSPITFVPVDEDLAAEAAEIARTRRIRGCDAIYVALAVRLNEPLITLDEEQLRRGGAVAVVQRPSAPEPEALAGDNGPAGGAGM